MRIAEALAENDSPKKLLRGDVAYYEFSRNGERHQVVPSVGHLFGLGPSGGSWDYPLFDADWKTRFEINPKEKFTRAYLENIKELAKEANEFVNACDYDIEGSVLAYNILRFACGVKDAKRMKFSTLVKEDLIRAYENASPTLERGMINAGLTRHYLDFFWGVNMTRALTLALNKAARLGFKILSTGRVQAPTLAILTKREGEIESFKPKPFWQVKLVAECDGHPIEGWFEKDRVWDKEEAEHVVENCEDRPAVVSSIARKRYKHKPPTPFSLTDLQVEAYRLFGYTPDRTLRVTQGLYEMAAVSYPRTASQKLPPQIGYRKILDSISALRGYEGLSKELLSKDALRPREGKKKDPAHVAIYPTTEVPKERLAADQRKVYDLIARRFMATFGEPASRESMKVTLKVGDFAFVVSGIRTIEENWYRFYKPYVKLKEAALPELREGQELVVKDIELVGKQTEPPKRYSPASLIRELESRGLGTKATRADVIKTLFDRGYVRGRSIRVTELGKGVTHTLGQHCPGILSEELTREFERRMELVEHGELSVDEVLESSKSVLLDILTKFKAREKEIGEYLAKELKRAERLTLGPCPKCKEGTLTVIYSKRTRKRFVGCSAYFKGKCDFSVPLPQRGTLDYLGKNCKECGYPVVVVKAKGRRPWRLCINPDCPKKKREK